VLEPPGGRPEAEAPRARSAGPRPVGASRCGAGAPRPARELTARMAAGDRAALGEFYEAWFERCLAMALGFTGRDESFGLDVVQEAMLRIARSVRIIPSEGELGAWVVTVVRRTALDLLRREARGRRRDRGRVATETPDPELRDRLDWLARRLESVPGCEAELLRLRFGQGGTLEQVGVAAGTSGPAVHGKLRRALQKLREAAKGEWT